MEAISMIRVQLPSSNVENKDEVVYRKSHPTQAMSKPADGCFMPNMSCLSFLHFHFLISLAQGVLEDAQLVVLPESRPKNVVVP